MANGEVNHEAIALAVIGRHGDVFLQRFQTRNKVKGLILEAMHDLEAHYGEDAPEPTEAEIDEEIVDLDMVYSTLHTVRQEIMDQAFSGNLARRHHLETAVALFADIGTLFRAEDIIRELFDPREEVEDEVPAVDNGGDQGEG